MFESHPIEELDAREACQQIAAAQDELVAVECRQLRLAAHWIDLHAPEDQPDARSHTVLPGTERAVACGADGTPMITEFAAAEYAALQDLHPMAGMAQLRKVANLRHRHPQLWARVLAGEVRAWKALETARLVGRDTTDQPGLSLEQARWVDAQTHEWITTLPWGAYLSLVESRVIAADPRAAETRRAEAEAETYVATTQSNDHGLKTLVAKAAGGEVVYLVAVVDRLAEVLAARGDTRPIGPRRASALTLLAHPAHALSLLATTGLDAAAAAADPEEPAAEQETAEAASPRPSFLDVPPDLAGVLKALTAQGLDRMLPTARLHVHLDHETFTSGAGSVLVEGIGPITLDQAREWLGHRRVTVVPVLDPLDQPPVQGYVFTPRLRDALHLVNPRDVFPFGVDSGRHKDIDHPVPYRPPDTTGIHNAAPMSRHHHRLKTHGRWRLHQLTVGSYLWHSPHGYSWLVDPSGTHRLPAAVARLLVGARSDVARAVSGDAA